MMQVSDCRKISKGLVRPAVNENGSFAPDLTFINTSLKKLQHEATNFAKNSFKNSFQINDFSAGLLKNSSFQPDTIYYLPCPGSRTGKRKIFTQF
jgi:hypothetical protein